MVVVVQPLDRGDLLHPTEESEKRRHKLKRLVKAPNSYFMDVKCPGCFNITTVFSHVCTLIPLFHVQIQMLSIYLSLLCVHHIMISHINTYCENTSNTHVHQQQAQTVVLCGSCSTVLCQPSGGRARLTEGCSFRKKAD